MKIQESAENYLETILILSHRNPYVRSIDIANELSFSKPSVSVAMKNLRENGYILMDDQGHITLSSIGKEIAETMYERTPCFPSGSCTLAWTSRQPWRMRAALNMWSAPKASGPSRTISPMGMSFRETTHKTRRQEHSQKHSAYRPYRAEAPCLFYAFSLSLPLFFLIFSPGSLIFFRVSRPVHPYIHTLRPSLGGGPGLIRNL